MKDIINTLEEKGYFVMVYTGNNCLKENPKYRAIIESLDVDTWIPRYSSGNVVDFNNTPDIYSELSYSGSTSIRQYTQSGKVKGFNGNVDLSDVPEGNYSLYVRARSGVYEAKEVLSNMLSVNIASKFTDSNNRGYQFRTNHYLKTVPIELFIRDKGLISNENAPTSDNMFNQYQDIELSDGKLNISGSSFNVGGDYGEDIEVERKIIFSVTKI